LHHKARQLSDRYTPTLGTRSLDLLHVAAALVYLSPLRAWLGRLREISGQIRGLGVLAPLVVTASIAVLVALGCPRLVFCAIAGMALGVLVRAVLKEQQLELAYGRLAALSPLGTVLDDPVR
jgi:hypothetical protein